MMKNIILFLCLLITPCFAGDDVIFVNGFEPPACIPEILLVEDFNVSNQQSWGGMWQESGDEVDVVEIINQQGGLIPFSSGYSLARMYYPLAEIDVEITFSFVFENGATQGVGFYVRSNGGYLQQTNPTGQGYAVFLERFTGQPQLGLWYENNGQEIPFIRDFDPNYELFDEVNYNVRFQVFQEGANITRLRARVWQADATEPTLWHVSLTDNYIPLQNILGGIAIDSWSTQTSGIIDTGIRIDDISVSRYCALQ